MKPVFQRLPYVLCLSLVTLLLGFGDGEPVAAQSSESSSYEEGKKAYEAGNYSKALEILKPLAEQGLADAQDSLGRMYAFGQGVPQDYKEAFKWYKLSAEQGKAFAQFNLGTMYEWGHGVTQDYKEALKWYRLSAEQGHANGQNSLGAMYANGKGVRDYVEAHKWFNIAGANGSEYGRKTRDIVEKRMSRDQIAEAQKLAREWMQDHGKK